MFQKKRVDPCTGRAILETRDGSSRSSR